MNKTKLVAIVSIGAAFLCVPLYLLKVISIGVVIGVFVAGLAAILLTVTGVLGKLFNKKQ